MNPAQITAWVATKEGLSIAQPTLGQPGFLDRQNTYHVRRGGKILATLKLGEDGLFTGESLGELHEATGRPKDMPGIGRIPVPVASVTPFFRNLGMEVFPVMVGRRETGDTIIRTPNGTGIHTFRGPIETELVRNLAGRSIEQLVTEGLIAQSEAVERLGEALARTEAEVGAFPASYLDPAETVADAFSVSFRRGPRPTVPAEGLNVAELDQFIDGAQSGNNQVFVTRTEYNSGQAANANTGEVARLREVYSVYSPSLKEGPMTVRVFEDVVDGERRPQINFTGVRNVAHALRLSDKMEGEIKAAEFATKTVPVHQRGSYEGYLRGRGEAVKWKEPAIRRGPEEGN